MNLLMHLLLLAVLKNMLALSFKQYADMQVWLFNVKGADTVKRAIDKGEMMAEIQLVIHTKGNFSILYLLI